MRELHGLNDALLRNLPSVETESMCLEMHILERTGKMVDERWVGSCGLIVGLNEYHIPFKEEGQ